MMPVDHPQVNHNRNKFSVKEFIPAVGPLSVAFLWLAAGRTSSGPT
jgi:hypothetical protein